MDSINSLVNQLKATARKLNYTGPVIEALCYLLADGIYKNSLNSITTLLEGSPTTCRLVNSAIQHAMDRGYSVNRGANQKITISNLFPTRTFSVKKYDQAVKVGSYYLYYNDDYSFTPGLVAPVEFVVGKTLVTEQLPNEPTSGNSGNVFKDSSYSDLTEVTLYRLDDNTNEFEEVPYTEWKRNLLDLDPMQSTALISNNNTINYWLVTRPDYSIRLWKFNKDLIEVNVGSIENPVWETQPNRNFDPSAIYRIKSLKYLPDNIDPLTIKTIPGFRFDGSSIPEFTQKSYIERESLINEIYLNTETADLSSFTVRSVNDISAITTAYFRTQTDKGIRGIKVATDNTTITVVYLLGNVNETLSTAVGGLIDSFNKFLVKAYYVNLDVVFHHATLASMEPPVGSPPGTPNLNKFSFEIYYQDAIDTNQVFEFFNNVVYNIGEDFNIFEFIGKLTKEFENIKWVKLVEGVTTTIPVAFTEYFQFEEVSNRTIDFIAL